MKTLSQIDEIRQRISVKNDIASALPLERRVYSDVKEYCANECWHIDEQRLDTDTDYLNQKRNEMDEYNKRAVLFNEELTKVYQFLVK